MKMLIVDVCDRVSKNGKPFRQAAIRGTGKSGDFLFVGIVPPDFEVGETYDNNVVFNQQGSAYVLPY